MVVVDVWLIVLGVLALVGWAGFVASVVDRGLVSRASIASVVSGFVVSASVVYCFVTGDSEFLKYVAGFALGYLFGYTRRGSGGGG